MYYENDLLGTRAKFTWKTVYAKIICFALLVHNIKAIFIASGFRPCFDPGPNLLKLRSAKYDTWPCIRGQGLTIFVLPILYFRAMTP